MSDIQDQPSPIPQPDRRPVWEMVVADTKSIYSAHVGIDRVALDDLLRDMSERDQVGRQRYGVPLTTHNGRDHVIDAYQEKLDASVYLRAAIAEGEPLVPIYHRTLEDLMSLRWLINERRARAGKPSE